MEKRFSAEFFLVVCWRSTTLNLRKLTFGYIDGERRALLWLKQSFIDDSSQLSSWTGKDCCKWKKVSCSKSIRHVLKLDLSSPIYLLDDDVHGEYSYKTFNFSEQSSTPQHNSCLMELKHLEYLDLSGNEFQHSRIPKFLGSMKHLRYLNLSHARFCGRIPDQLGNLIHLQDLDLSYEDDVIINSRGLYADNFQWVLSLSSLRHLSMTYVDLTKALDMIQVLSMLPSLLYLSLDNCGIQNIHFSRSPLNSTFSASIHFLSLAVNMLTGSIPNALLNMTATFNSYNTTVPFWSGNLKSLVSLNLAMNDFDHIKRGLLSMLNNACSLKSLHLSFKPFLARCLVYDLEFSDSSNNEIGGGMEDWLGQLKVEWYHSKITREIVSLGKVNSIHNQLYGIIPQSFGGLSNLKQLDQLDLWYNQLTGSFPYNLGKLVNLEILDVSSNGLEGIVSEVHFSKLSSLNKLWNNMLISNIPSQLCQLNDLQIMDLAGKSLTGGIPCCFGMLTKEPAPGPVLGSISTEKPTLATVLGPISAWEPTTTSSMENYDELWNGEKVSEFTKGLDVNVFFLYTFFTIKGKQ
ncbi:LRR domain containing protein [Parasponia andersonii]|uniref:LRR domain containing protein n=1 Tax=Parasponia andersonii TaxID=3476 RepID=A0A2P5BSD0_PARAD|nr:LRR domain containing protein [Parasponia andersonii]